ncbi:MAG: hypothetical protein KGL39_04595 [Patescibacteria group bacterium]|nr:hypothetical protein [Patescibacteria group bacterium]
MSLYTTNTFTPNVGFTEQSFGSNIGTWGTYENDNWTTTDTQLGGTLYKDISGNADIIVTDDESLYFQQYLTGTLTADIQYIVPAKGRRYVVNNQTSGGHSVSVVPFSGSGSVQVNAGDVAYIIVYPNPNVSTATVISLGSNIAIPVSIPDGGTGATTAEGARANFGASDPTKSAFASVTGSGSIVVGNVSMFSDVDGTVQDSGIPASEIIYSGGPQISPTVTKSANYPVGTKDYTIRCDATSAGFTITLPAVASNTGRLLNIKKIDSTANQITISGDGNIDGQAQYYLSFQNQSIQIQSNGSTWDIL